MKSTKYAIFASALILFLILASGVFALEFSFSIVPKNLEARWNTGGCATGEAPYSTTTVDCSPGFVGGYTCTYNCVDNLDGCWNAGGGVGGTTVTCQCGASKSGKNSAIEAWLSVNCIIPLAQIPYPASLSISDGVMRLDSRNVAQLLSAAGVTANYAVGINTPVPAKTLIWLDSQKRDHPTNLEIGAADFSTNYVWGCLDTDGNQICDYYQCSESNKNCFSVLENALCTNGTNRNWGWLDIADKGQIVTQSCPAIINIGTFTQGRIPLDIVATGTEFLTCKASNFYKLSSTRSSEYLSVYGGYYASIYGNIYTFTETSSLSPPLGSKETISGHEYLCYGGTTYAYADPVVWDVGTGGVIYGCAGEGASSGINSKVTGNIAVGQYCSADGIWRTNLDGMPYEVNNKTCRAAGLNWTGTKCCSEAEDNPNSAGQYEYYNDPGGKGGCWNSNYIASGKGVNRATGVKITQVIGTNAIANINGTFYGCNITQTVSGFTFAKMDSCDSKYDPATHTTITCGIAGNWTSGGGAFLRSIGWAAARPNEPEPQGCCAENECWAGSDDGSGVYGCKPKNTIKMVDDKGYICTGQEFVNS